jgi:Rad3-related DNA helicase
MVTPQKTLQDQYSADFEEIAVVKGRNAYHCAATSNYADVGLCVLNKKRACDPCELSGKLVGCDYVEALNTAEGAQTALFNYSAFYAHSRNERFPPRELLVLDEGHQTESVALGMVQLTLGSNVVDLVKGDTTLDIIHKLRQPDGPFFVAVREYCQDIVHQSRCAPEGKEKTKALREVTKARALYDKIGYVYDQYARTLQPDYTGPRFEDQWVLETETPMGSDLPIKVTLKPVFAGPFVPRMFLWRGARVLFMSATILEPETFCKSVGIRPEEAAFVSIPCHYPVKNRLVHVYPCGDLTYRSFNEGIQGVLQGIRRVLELHKKDRGIIHAHSWKILKVIRDNIADPRLIFQDPKARDRNLVVEHLKHSSNGVLVAPAMHEGLDLKDDWSRFQVIAKIPWPNFGDPQIKARAAVDDRWCVWTTAVSIVQGSGRSIRTPTDFAATYILDSNFKSFYARSKLKLQAGKRVSLLPAWYMDAVRTYDEDETEAFLAGKGIPSEV